MSAKALIENKEIIKLQTELFLLGNKAGKNFNNKITQRFGRRRAPKILKDGIREKFEIKASKVFDKISVKSTGQKFNGGIIVNARSRQKGLEHFKTSPRRTTPSRRVGTLKATTEKGKSKTFIKIFTGKSQQGSSNFFYQRAGVARLPLKRLVGPSLSKMYQRNAEKIESQYQNGFIKEAIDSIEATKRRMAKR